MAETLHIRRPEHKLQTFPHFQRVEAVPSLTFGIKMVDDFFLGIRKTDALCLFGQQETLLASRLSVRTLLPSRLGGLESSVLFLDGGNNSDIYQCVNFARQYGLDVRKVLEGIVVSRAFTIHQLAWLVIHELPKAIARFGSRLVIVSGLLTMFVQDPQVDRNEARRLLREILNAVRKVSDKAIVIITADNIHGYEDLFAKLRNRIEMQSSGNNLRLMLSSSYRSKEVVLSEKVLRTAKVA